MNADEGREAFDSKTATRSMKIMIPSSAWKVNLSRLTEASG
jgi:hypothetical protein